MCDTLKLSEAVVGLTLASRPAIELNIVLTSIHAPMNKCKKTLRSRGRESLMGHPFKEAAFI